VTSWTAPVVHDARIVESNGELILPRQQRRPGTLPFYTLRVDGTVVRHLLVDLFDGPFPDDEAYRGAMLLRTSL
jgi:hypothetical protein